MAATTTTTWTGATGSDWDTGTNWSNGVPTIDGEPVWPGELAVIASGAPVYNDLTLDATTVLLDGTLSTSPILDIASDGASLGPGVIVAATSAGVGGVLEAIGGDSDAGELLASSSGAILQFDPITAGNALLRELFDTTGLLRATNGGTLQLGQPASTQSSENQGGTLPEFDYLQSTGLILADDGGTVQVNIQLGNLGELVASGGTILATDGAGFGGISEIYNALVNNTGPGVLDIANGGLLETSALLGEPIDFTDATGTLDLIPDASSGELPLVAGIAIEGFRPGDLIVLQGTTISDLSYTFGIGSTFGQPGTLTFQASTSSGLITQQISLDGDYRQDTFSVTSNGQGIVVTGPSSSGSTSDTVPASGGVSRTVSFGAAPLAALAQPLISAITTSKALFVDTSAASVMTSSQTSAIVDTSGAATVVGNAAANETVAAGSGAFNFFSGSGSGSVFAGGGTDLLYFSGGGNWRAALGNGTGVDTVVASTGSDTIATGNGRSIDFLGAGATSLTSAGTDTVIGASGSATVAAASANNDLVFALGGPLQFIAGGGASTVVAGTSATLYGGSANGTLAFDDGSTQYFGSAASDTVIGLAGSMTAIGGAGGGLFFGGAAGNNEIIAGSGRVTSFGGGANDVLTATGSASDLFAAGAGAETLTGLGSTGTNTFFAGSGADEMVAGAGATAMVAGKGNDLMVGGAGADLFLFANGATAGGSDTISGFDVTHDFVDLVGYTTSDATVLQNATSAGGSLVITLSDGTNITLAGISQIPSFSLQ